MRKLNVHRLRDRGRGSLGPRRLPPVAALVLAAVLLAGACGATPAAPTAAPGTSSHPAVATATPSETATPAPSDAGAPLLAVTALPAEIEPVDVSSGRVLYQSETGSSGVPDSSGVLNLATGSRDVLPALTGGRRFAAGLLAGTIAAGGADTVAPDGSIAAQSALAFDLAARRFLDIGAALGHPALSYVLGADGATVVGMASDGQGTEPTRAYLYDVATGRVTIMPGLPDGYGVPQPLAVSGRYVVGNDGTPAGGFVYDIVDGRYTMLWDLLGTHRVEAVAVDGNVVVGGALPIGASDFSPFVYDLGAGPQSVSPIPMPGFTARAVDGARVLLRHASSVGLGPGWVFRTDTMTGIPLDQVRDPGSATGTSAVDPVAISGGWVLGRVVDDASTGGPLRMVLIAIPPAN
jgi:hypothetical protein